MFAFNASAISFGGIRTAPQRKIFPSIGSAVLAPTGGEASALVTNYADDVVAFDRAETLVWGSADSKGYKTHSEVKITGLRLFEDLTIDLLTASLTSTRSLKEKESQFVFRAQILGARIGDEELESESECEFFDQMPTYDSFRRFVENADVKLLAERFGWENVVKNDMIKRDMVGVPLLSPGKKKKYGGGIHRKGGTFVVPGYGTVHLGEVTLKPSMRRINLVRLELNRTPKLDDRAAKSTTRARKAETGAKRSASRAPSEEGSGTAGLIEGNGSTVFPP